MTEVKSSLQMLAEVAYPSSAPSFPSISPQVARYTSVPTGKLIFVIDGSPTIQKVVEMTLRHEGHEVRPFCNGIEAMKWFARPEARIPDVMLVDLGLPKMDGYDVIQKFKVKPCFAKTTCILLSRYHEGVDKLKGKRVGAAAYLAKPFTTQELLTAVQASLSGQCLHDRLYA
jgi:twitching motility two-component system response regulator PilG